MSESKDNKVWKVISSCSICGKHLNKDSKPQLLPCCHSSCKDCIEENTKILSDNITQKSAATEINRKCKVCFQEYSPEQCRDNYFYLSYLSQKSTNICHSCERENKVVIKCNTCDWICENCQTLHKTIKIFKEHKLDETTKISSKHICDNNLCSLHNNQELTIYCNTCQSPYCCHCFILDEHNSHVYFDIKDNKHLEALYNNLTKKVESIKKKRIVAENTLANNFEPINTEINTVDEQKEKCFLKIKNLVNKLTEKVTEFGTTLSFKVDNLYQKKEKELNDKKKLLMQMNADFELIEELTASNNLSVNKPISVLKAQDMFVNAQLKKLMSSSQQDFITNSKIEVIDTLSDGQNFDVEKIIDQVFNTCFKVITDDQKQAVNSRVIQDNISQEKVSSVIEVNKSNTANSNESICSGQNVRSTITNKVKTLKHTEYEDIRKCKKNPQSASFTLAKAIKECETTAQFINSPPNSTASELEERFTPNEINEVYQWPEFTELKLNLQTFTAQQLSDFRTPFRMGWKREIVLRRDINPSSKRIGNVYYISPDKKTKFFGLAKINSYLKKIGSNLQQEKNLFTFVQQPIYRPPAETVRYAHLAKKKDCETFNIAAKAIDSEVAPVGRNLSASTCKSNEQVNIEPKKMIPTLSKEKPLFKENVNDNCINSNLNCQNFTKIDANKDTQTENQIISINLSDISNLSDTEIDTSSEDEEVLINNNNNNNKESEIICQQMNIKEINSKLNNNQETEPNKNITTFDTNKVIERQPSISITNLSDILSDIETSVSSEDIEGEVLTTDDKVVTSHVDHNQFVSKDTHLSVFSPFFKTPLVCQEKDSLFGSNDIDLRVTQNDDNYYINNNNNNNNNNKNSSKSHKISRRYRDNESRSVFHLGSDSRTEFDKRIAPFDTRNNYFNEDQQNRANFLMINKFTANKAFQKEYNHNDRDTEPPARQTVTNANGVVNPSAISIVEEHNKRVVKESYSLPFSPRYRPLLNQERDSFLGSRDTEIDNNIPKYRNRSRSPIQSERRFECDRLGPFPNRNTYFIDDPRNGEVITNNERVYSQRFLEYGNTSSNSNRYRQSNRKRYRSPNRFSSNRFFRSSSYYSSRESLSTNSNSKYQPFSVTNSNLDLPK